MAAKGSTSKGLCGRWLLQDTTMRALQPFFVVEYKTHCCEVKYMQ